MQRRDVVVDERLDHLGVVVGEELLEVRATEVMEDAGRNDDGG